MNNNSTGNNSTEVTWAFLQSVLSFFIWSSAVARKLSRVSAPDALHSRLASSSRRVASIPFSSSDTSAATFSSDTEKHWHQAACNQNWFPDKTLTVILSSSSSFVTWFNSMLQILFSVWLMFSVTSFFAFSILSTRGHPYKFVKASCSTSCHSQFFNQRIVNIWNSLPHIVDFTSLTSFKRTINNVDYSDFLKVFWF